MEKGQEVEPAYLVDKSLGDQEPVDLQEAIVLSGGEVHSGALS